ncbi:MAG: phosphodiester glycosidase family protein [Deinococcales bacterium]
MARIRFVLLVCVVLSSVSLSQMGEWQPLPEAAKTNELLLPLPALPSSNSVRLEQRKVLGVSLKIVYVNLEHPMVQISAVLPQHVFRKGAPFDTLVAGSSAIALFNGGYFHPKTFSPVGDLVVDGKWLNQGRLRSGLAITKANTALLWTKDSGTDPRGYKTLIGSGPILVRDKKINPVPKAEGYADSSIWSRAPRSAVGIVADKKIVLVSTRQALTLRELGKVMHGLKAKDAIALDGGSSVGMAWKGKVLIHPKRKIAFGVGVYIR